jgi:hypothetical protein
MLKRQLRWLLPAIVLCAALYVAYVHLTPPSALPNGHVADTREEFEKRKTLMAAAGQPLADDIRFNSTQARELATRESLDAMKARLATTGLSYDFQWRAHLSQEALAAWEAEDARYPPSASRWPTKTTLVRPGVWRAIFIESAASQAPDLYIIRVSVRPDVALAHWSAEARFRFPPSPGVPEAVLSCGAGNWIPSSTSYGYCSLPALNQRANDEADAPLLDRLVKLQTEGPSPGMVAAKITWPSGLVAASGEMAEEVRQEEQRGTRERAADEARRSVEQTATYIMYAIAGLILFGLPSLALFGAIRARRSRAARKGSGVYGVVCVGMAGAAAYGITLVHGGDGTLLVLALAGIALVAGVAGLIALVGAAFGTSE